MLTTLPAGISVTEFGRGPESCSVPSGTIIGADLTRRIGCSDPVCVNGHNVPLANYAIPFHGQLPLDFESNFVRRIATGEAGELVTLACDVAIAVSNDLPWIGVSFGRFGRFSNFQTGLQPSGYLGLRIFYANMPDIQEQIAMCVSLSNLVPVPNAQLRVGRNR
jgi:hypothetical protein